MSEVEVILKQEAGVKAHDSESPPTVGLRADGGSYSPTLLGLLVLNYFSDFLHEASKLNKQLSHGLTGSK